jgi:hypothetical protein
MKKQRSAPGPSRVPAKNHPQSIYPGWKERQGKGAAGIGVDSELQALGPAADTLPKSPCASILPGPTVQKRFERANPLVPLRRDSS